VIPFHTTDAGTGTPPPPPPPPPPPKGATSQTPEPGESSAAASADYTFRRSFGLNAEALPWVAPVCLAVLFLVYCINYFPWTGIWIGDQFIVQQSGVDVAFGTYSEFREKSLEFFSQRYLPMTTHKEDTGKGEQVKNVFERPTASPLGIIFFLVMLFGLLAIATFLILPKVKPEIIKPFASYYMTVVAVISFLTFTILCFQLLIGFPLNDTAVRRFKIEYDKQKEAASTVSRLQLEAGLDYSNKLSFLETGVGLRLCVLLNFLAVFGSGLELVLNRRPNRPLPRFTFEA
jgi:hypothetical protein